VDDHMRNPATATEEMAKKEAQVLNFLHAQQAVGVAFSGGTDSTYLLALALEALGPQNVLALTATTEFVPPKELEQAQELARILGARHNIVRLSLLDVPQVAGNPPDRCYWCKKAILTALRTALRDEREWTLVHGANADDSGAYRPGERAASELGVPAPLQMAGLTKAEIRALARARGLPNWARPADSCLATRFPYGTQLAPEGLARVAKAEAFLRTELGLQSLRVRVHGETARLELPPESWPDLLAGEHLPRIVETLRSLGFVYVTLDLMGLRSGSMDDLLRAP